MPTVMKHAANDLGYLGWMTRRLDTLWRWLHFLDTPTR